MKCIGEKCAAWRQHDFNESWFQCAIDPSGHSRKKGQNNKCCIDEEIEDRKRALAELEDLRKEIVERSVLWTWKIQK